MLSDTRTVEPLAAAGKHEAPVSAPSAVGDADGHLAYLAALEDWAEREARGDGPWLVDELARDGEDRRFPPAPEQVPGIDGPAIPERAPNTTGGTAGPDEAPKARTIGRAPVSMGEVKSTARRYVLAAARVDEAYGLLETRLRDDAGRAGWSMREQVRAAAMLRRADATAGRRVKVRRCVVGDVQVPTFRCKCCGQVKLGVPMTCNSRTCPRCIGKLRRANQAKVHELLERVDERRARPTPWPRYLGTCSGELRRQQGRLCWHPMRLARQAARWRFLTLTLPSLPDFEPMRRHIAAAWSQLMRTRTWRDRVTACVVAFESTHTRAGWHVHLHAIVDAWLPLPQIVRQWQKIVARLIERDALDARKLWTPRIGSGSAGERTRRAWQVLRALERDTPHTWQGVRARAAESADWAAARSSLIAAGGDRDGIVDLGELVPDALRAVVPGASRAEQIRTRRQVRQWARMLPRARAQDIRATHGTRAEVVRELAKYAAKDLGGAGVENGTTWGVAGTAPRLAEFMAGSFRWRTLRAYGDAYDAELRERKPELSCDDCGSGMEFDRTRIYTPAEWAAIDRARRQKRAATPHADRRGDPRPVVPAVARRIIRAPSRADVAAAAAVDSDSRMAIALDWWRNTIGDATLAVPSGSP